MKNVVIIYYQFHYILQSQSVTMTKKGFMSDK